MNQQTADSFQMREQRRERRLHLHQHRCTLRRNELGVTAKLNRVAEPLLRIKQHRLAGNDRLAPPRGLRKIASRIVEAFVLKTPLVFSPSVFKVSQGQST